MSTEDQLGFIPLINTGFDKNLDSNVTNLQALAEAVDELTLVSNVRLLTSDLVLLDKYSLVLSEYLDASTYNLDLQGDACLEIL